MASKRSRSKPKTKSMTSAAARVQRFAFSGPRPLLDGEDAVFPLSGATRKTFAHKHRLLSLTRTDFAPQRLGSASARAQRSHGADLVRSSKSHPLIAGERSPTQKWATVSTFTPSRDSDRSAARRSSSLAAPTASASTVTRYPRFIADRAVQ